MATPTIRGQSVTGSMSNPSGTTSATVSLAVPAGTVAGDLMVALISFNTSSADGTVIAPAGWTTLSTFDPTPGSNVNHQKVAYRRMVAGDPTSWSFYSTEPTSGRSAPTFGIALVSVGGATGIRAGTPAYRSPATPALAPGIKPDATGQMILVSQSQYSNAPAATVSWSRSSNATAINTVASGTSYNGSAFWSSFVSTNTQADDATGTNSNAYNISGQQFLILTNSAPNAPALNSPANNATIDRGITQRFAWTFSDPDTGDSQSKFDLQYRVVGTTPWTTVSSTTPNAFYDFAAGTFAAGNYEWQVRTYDSQGVVGPWSSSSFFTAATAPATPTITAPVNGSTVSSTATLTWSAPNQTDYQWRRVADNAGAANTSTVYADSGDVVDATTRSVTATFDTNNRWEHLQVRVKYNGLWSAWADARVQVSYTPPATPTRTLTADSTTATIMVAITNPAPGAGQPAVAYNDVYVDDGDGLGFVRKATAVATNGTWIYRLPISGRDYSTAIKVTAVATNGTTASSS